MIYKRMPDLHFDWSYEELMDLPLFMIDHIYEVLDGFVEEDRKRYQNVSPA